MQILEAEFIAGATALDDLPPPAFAEIAFAGRSNVGKSSLINSLVQRKKLVRTSGDPGCTRAINIFRVRGRDEDANEARLDLVDLPGYGYARRSKAERNSWGPLIESFLSGRPGLRATVIIVDVRRGIEEDDEQLLEYLDSVDVPALIVATKLDKLPTSKRKVALSAVREAARAAGGAEAPVPVIGYSSASGEGRDYLWKRLLSIASISA